MQNIKIVQCKDCGKTEIAKRSSKIYCSDCIKKRKKQKDLLLARKQRELDRKHYQKKCCNCGNEFETSKLNQKYCSNKCYKEISKAKNALRYQKYGIYTKQLHFKDCLICGKEFTTTNNRRKYCSKDCQYKAHLMHCKM